MGLRRTRLGVVSIGVVVLTAAVVAGTVSVTDRSSVPPAASVAASDQQNPCIGTIERRPANATLLSIQGFHDGQKRAAMVVGIGPDGSVTGVHNASANGRRWAYDVDPLTNGTLLLSATVPGISIVERLDPETGEHVSVRRFPDVLDSHDADRISDDELLLNDMSRDGEARIFVYNTTREAVTWEYRFADYPDQFPRAGGGEFAADWTHNNDVEQIDDGVFMVSVRNFDQAVAIDRETKEIVWKLGSDDDHGTLFEQHNPDYIESDNGTPTVLVADSENDRVVEYARTDGNWTRTWILRGGGLTEPRDADRLPNGNTLIADRFGHRLVEVTPRGEIVWEMYAPWQPYDAERLGTGDESTGPTMRAAGVTGTHELTGGRGVDERWSGACYDYLTADARGDSLIPPDSSRRESPTRTTAQEQTAVTPATGWGRGFSGPLVAPGLVAAAVVALAAVLGSFRVLRE